MVMGKYNRSDHQLTLEMECLCSCPLPSTAYGYKRCSQKHKIRPQEKFCNHYLPCRAIWAGGGGEDHLLPGLLRQGNAAVRTFKKIQ